MAEDAGEGAPQEVEVPAGASEDAAAEASSPAEFEGASPSVEGAAASGLDSFGGSVASSPPPQPGYSPEPEDEDGGPGLQEYIADSNLVKQYAAATQDAGRKRNPLIERSLLESEAAGGETFYIQAPGNEPQVFTSRLGDDDARVLSQVLAAPAPYLERLDLRFNNLTDVGAEHLTRGLLVKARRLENLSLRGNAIGPAGCATVAGALLNCRSLRSLDMACNPLGRDGGLALNEVLKANPEMEELYLKDTEIDIDVIVSIATTLLMQGAQLRVCDLENPRIQTLQEEHTVHLGRMLRVNVHLSEIYLGKHRMRDEGVRQLVSFLLENKTLKVLDLRCNELGAAGAQHLAKLLSMDCQLRRLNLEGNRIGEKGNIDGAAALSEALLQNRMLSSLSLNNNMLCGEALQCLADAMERNTTLEVMELFHNNWDQTSSYKFHQVLTSGVRPLPLRTDFVTSEVGLRVDVCQLQGFKVGGA